MQGWIDLLVETADGYVIIDHKSYPGTDNEERVKEYSPQLRVIELLLHLPVSGLILKMQGE